VLPSVSNRVNVKPEQEPERLNAAASY
jgi:hypothetical protein